MFRLHKTRAIKSGERIDFKLSHFKALQVPKGWDKLFVSVISVKNGKTIAKSGKALVRNGTCQWTETISESIWVSQEESSKDLEDCFLKLVVAMGSSRSATLGEATVNMTGYMSSSAVVPVSLPLNKCNHGTTLQVKIHCLTPRKKLREDESKEPKFYEEYLSAESHDMDIKSDGPDSMVPRSNGSSPNNELGSALHKEEPESRGTSFAASNSHGSYNSVEGSIERQNFSSRKNLDGNDGQNLIGLPDSTSSQNNLPEGNYHADKPSESNPSSFNSDADSGSYSKNNQQELAASSFGISTSSKSLLVAADDTIQELRAESKMWKRNAQKLMLDLDTLKKEFSDLSKNQENLEMELSAACTERDGFKREVEQLKMLLEKMTKPTAVKDSSFQDEGAGRITKELEEEIKFQKESNTNLTLQLKRSQESNIELVVAIQELEETIRSQKLEIKNLSSLQSKFSHMEKSFQVNTEENKKTNLQLQQLQESERNLLTKVQLLEQALKEKEHSIEDQVGVDNQNLLHVETEYKGKLSAKDDEIASLKVKLSEFHKEKHSEELESKNGGEDDQNREIETLKAKLQELERDCNELTDENLELLFKLKEMKNYSIGSSELLEDSEVSHPETEVHNLEEKLKNKVLREIKIQFDESMQQLEILKNELEVKVTGLAEELSKKRSETERLEANLLSKEEEINDLLYSQRELEAKVATLQKEKLQLEENIEIVSKETNIATKCLNDLQNDLRVLSSSVDSHVSANRTLEKKSAELDSGKRELELHLSELEHENAQLSVSVSSLEAQVRLLNDEKESRQLELENSNALVMNLQDELTRLRNDTETQENNLKEKLEEIHIRWSEAQEECEYLRRENLKLQATAKRIIKECSSIQKSNGDLKKKNFELQQYCTHLEENMRKSTDKFANCSRKVENLEENLSSILEDVALRDKSITSQLDALLDENGKQKEKLTLAESLLTQVYEMTIEVENLQQEIANLTKQLSASHDEKERIAFEADHQVSGLHADKAKLESAIQELQSKVKWAENELNAAQVQCEAEVQGLMDELAASKQNQEMMMANHEKLLKQLEIFKSREDKFKVISSDLELKLTVSEYERQQLMKDSTSMKVQLLRIEHLENEILSLKNELNATKSEREQLKNSLHLISAECEHLKSQKYSFLEKISTLQKDVSELEDCKRNRVALEEKLLQMEDDLRAKEKLCMEDTELKNELSSIRKANSQLQWKIQLLEEEKDKLLMRAQALEKELRLTKEQGQNQGDASSINSYSSQSKREGDNRDNEHEIHNESSTAVRVEPDSKFQLLEAELAKSMEANSMCKAQINRLLKEGKSGRANAKKLTAEGEVVTKERFERTKSSLESELRDIRERYLQMSLKYAEVEAQREELVMKLRIAKNGKRWLS